MHLARPESGRRRREREWRSCREPCPPRLTLEHGQACGRDAQHARSHHCRGASQQ